MPFFDTNDLDQPESAAPCPQDPVVLQAMVRRGMVIYAFIIALTLTVAPALLIGAGLATFSAMGIPVCGVVGQLEVLEDPMRCGTKIAWEFYVGIASLALGFFFASANLQGLVTKGRAGIRRQQNLKRKLEAAAAAAGEAGGADDSV